MEEGRQSIAKDEINVPLALGAFRDKRSRVRIQGGFKNMEEGRQSIKSENPRGL